jgi:hypothetical protein
VISQRLRELGALSHVAVDLGVTETVARLEREVGVVEEGERGFPVARREPCLSLSEAEAGEERAHVAVVGLDDRDGTGQRPFGRGALPGGGLRLRQSVEGIDEGGVVRPVETSQALDGPRQDRDALPGPPFAYQQAAQQELGSPLRRVVVADQGAHRERPRVLLVHDPYLKVLRKRLPKAALVFDHFHVSKIVHDALDEIRRRLQRELPPAERRIIKEQRYVLLRARETLSTRQEVSLQEILNTNTDLTKGYILKEAFREVFKATNLREGRRRLKEWEAQVRESGVPELIKVLDTIERRRSGIENFFQYKVANGMAEGFNNVVGTIKKQAYGFHDRDYLRLKILRICGKLE